MRKLSLKELNRLSIADFKEIDKTPIVLVLDDIRSALNVGSAFRTADAFAVAHVHLCGITAQPPHREILKTAIGATESVEWTYHKSVTDAIVELKKDGHAVFAVEQTTASMPLQSLEIPVQPVALVFGNEVQGVSNAAIELVDGAIEIPQYGTKHSLNISVCLGIVVWEVFRKMRF